MRNVVLFCITIMAGLFLPSCENDYFSNDAKLYTVTLSVHYPSNYLVASADSVTVKLINQTNSLSVEGISDKDGNVTFSNVVRGTYRISANTKIPALRARNLGDTIVSDEDIADGKRVNLNATMQDVFIDKNNDLGTLSLKSSMPGSLLIKEVFYTGTRTASGKAYYSDQFVELYNNTDQIIYTDSLYIANVYGANGNSDTDPSVFQSVTDSVVLEFVFMIPGTGKSHPLLPGKSLIIAEDGMNHNEDPNGNPGRSIDLSGADWETYLYRPENQKDVDFLEVPNLTEIFDNRYGTFDWILHSRGPGIVIFKATDLSKAQILPEPYNNLGYQVMMIPNKWVLDAFEALAYSYSGRYKRVPKELDAGFIYCHDIFDGESCRRKVEDIIDGRVILQDFNNTSEDFEVISFPTPRVFY